MPQLPKGFTSNVASHITPHLAFFYLRFSEGLILEQYLICGYYLCVYYADADNGLTAAV